MRLLLALPTILAAAAAAAATDGERIYISKGCPLCHGYAAQGALLTGPRLGPDPLPLPAFRSAVREPRNEMPAYAPSVLSDAEIEQIHRYLESLPAPPDPAALGVFPDP